MNVGGGGGGAAEARRQRLGARVQEPGGAQKQGCGLQNGKRFVGRGGNYT